MLKEQNSQLPNKQIELIELSDDNMETIKGGGPVKVTLTCEGEPEDCNKILYGE